MDSLRQSITDHLMKHLNNKLDELLFKNYSNFFIFHPALIKCSVDIDMESADLHIKANASFDVFVEDHKDTYIYTSLTSSYLSPFFVTEVTFTKNEAMSLVFNAKNPVAIYRDFVIDIQCLNRILKQNIPLLLDWKRSLLEDGQASAVIYLSNGNIVTAQVNLEDPCHYGLRTNDEIALALSMPEVMLGIRLKIKPDFINPVLVSKIIVKLNSSAPYIDCKSIVQSMEKPVYETNVMILFNLFRGESNSYFHDGRSMLIPMQHRSIYNALPYRVDRLFINSKLYNDFFDTNNSNYFWDYYKRLLISSHQTEVMERNDVIFANVTWYQPHEIQGRMRISTDHIFSGSAVFHGSYAHCQFDNYRDSQRQIISDAINALRMGVMIFSKENILKIMRLFYGDNELSICNIYSKKIMSINLNLKFRTLEITIEHFSYKPIIQYIMTHILKFIYCNTLHSPFEVIYCQALIDHSHEI